MLTRLTKVELARAVLEAMQARRVALLNEIDRYALQAIEQDGEVPDPRTLTADYVEALILGRWVGVLEQHIRRLEGAVNPEG